MSGTIETDKLGGTVGIYGTNAQITGSITAGCMTGEITCEGPLAGPTADFTRGHIIVTGAFSGAPGMPAEIRVTSVTNNAFIATDYDPADPNAHVWQDAVVYVNGVPYTEPQPQLHIWRYSKCRGDLSCDNQVTYDDINPLVQALSDPQAYAFQYAGNTNWTAPWTTGPVFMLHGDLNCDGLFDFNEINAFPELVGHCYYYCPYGDDPPSAPPEQTADALRAHVRPENRVPLLSIVAQTAMQARSRAVRDYWQAVYEHLTR
ncbi:MAG: hypothetical protein AB1716_20505 [Planctomycetota bacterium]